MTPELNKRRQTTVSVWSLVLSFLATSHHTIHIALMMLMTGSMGSMSMMSGSASPAIVWFRRVMVVATFVTAGFSVYRLLRHRCKERWTVTVTVVSSVLSIGFVVYTLVNVGW